MENFAVVTETFIDENGNSSVTSLVYDEIDAGKSAFYDKAKYVPIYTGDGYKAVTIVDYTMNNILDPVIKDNRK